MLDQNQSQDLSSLLPGQRGPADTNRRAALQLALGVGYAAAAMPIMAQTAIKTPSDGLHTGESVYDVAGFTVPFYFAAPEGKTNLPVVLVVHEILVCTRTSLTSAAVLPRPVTWRLHPICTHARATPALTRKWPL